MKIKVLFFAQLREAFQEQERVMDVSQGTTADGLVQLILKNFQADNISTLPIRCAVNESFVEADYQLKDQDIVSLITPFAGG